MVDNKTIKDTQALKYEGFVTLALESNGKIYNTVKSHNSGKWPLFYAVACSLAGNYDIAEPYRPKFIRLFSDVDSQTENTLVAIPIDTAPSVIKDTTGDYATVSFKFTIPGSYLKSTRVMSAALYSQAYKNVIDCYDAVVTFSQSLVPPNININEYNVIVTWEMKFSN